MEQAAACWDEVRACVPAEGLLGGPFGAVVEMGGKIVGERVESRG